MLGPLIQGERISLEPQRLEDCELICRWFATVVVMRYTTRPFVPSVQQQEDRHRRNAEDEHGVYWRIAVEGRTIGLAHIDEIDWMHRHGETGTLIGDPSDWGKGYAGEVVKLRTAYAFRELGLERLESQSAAENVAMHRALEKAGYRNIATRRRMYYREGRWQDDYLFELLRGEWEARQAR